MMRMLMLVILSYVFSIASTNEIKLSEFTLTKSHLVYAYIDGKGCVKLSDTDNDRIYFDYINNNLELVTVHKVDEVNVTGHMVYMELSINDDILPINVFDNIVVCQYFEKIIED